MKKLVFGGLVAPTLYAALSVFNPMPLHEVESPEATATNFDVPELGDNNSHFILSENPACVALGRMITALGDYGDPAVVFSHEGGVLESTVDVGGLFSGLDDLDGALPGADQDEALTDFVVAHAQATGAARQIGATVARSVGGEHITTHQIDIDQRATDSARGLATQAIVQHCIVSTPGPAPLQPIPLWQRDSGDQVTV